MRDYPELCAEELNIYKKNFGALCKSKHIKLFLSQASRITAKNPSRLGLSILINSIWFHNTPKNLCQNLKITEICGLYFVSLQDKYATKSDAACWAVSLIGNLGYCNQWQQSYEQFTPGTVISNDTLVERNPTQGQKNSLKDIPRVYKSYSWMS